MKDKSKGYLSLFTCTFIWGLAFIAVQNALNYGWQTFPLMTIRSLIGAAFMLLFSYKRKWWKDLKVVRLGIINGILMWLGYTLQTFGQSNSSVPNSAFITTLNIVFVPLILHLFYQREISKKVYVSAFIALLGVGILSYQGTLALHLGDTYLLLCAICFALQIINNERLAKYDNTLSFITLQLITMFILSLIMMPISGQTNIPNKGWLDLLYIGLFSSGIAGFLQMFGQKHVNPSAASLILCLESVIATIASVFVLGQEVTINIIVGGGLLITAVILVIETNKKGNLS